MSSASVGMQLSDRTLYQYLQNALDKIYPELSGNGNKQWQDIVNGANLVSLPAGTELLNPDAPCTQFMLLVEGCVRVFQQTPNDREVTLYRTHGGDLCVLSINGLMKNKEFGAFAASETAITALVFSREQFMHAMASYEPFRNFVLVTLTDRFNDVLTLIEETVFESLDTRLVCLLARMAREQNDDKLHITHQEIARELGSSREVISRLLKGLERQGCIELGRGVIHIDI